MPRVALEKHFSVLGLSRRVAAELPREYSPKCVDVITHIATLFATSDTWRAHFIDRRTPCAYGIVTLETDLGIDIVQTLPPNNSRWLVFKLLAGDVLNAAMTEGIGMPGDENRLIKILSL